MALLGEPSIVAKGTHQMVSREVNLLDSLPKSKRDSKARVATKTPEVVAEAKRFGYAYFDGTREQGYGGYKYDKRWVPVAKEIIEFFKLKPGDKILDIGCAKAFLLYDLAALGKFELYGLDISQYALNRRPVRLKAKLTKGTAEKLPYEDNFFDLVISINTLHNLPRDGVIRALKEIGRVSKGNSYVVVDSYRTPEEKKQFEDWQLTAETHMYPEEWVKLFEEAGYGGHYGWNILS